MRNILLLVIITIGTCLYSCIPINLSFNKSDNKIDYRNSYLNNLEFVKFEQNADTLQCFFIQPRYEFLDPVGAKQNTFYLLHDKTHAFNLKKPFEYIQVYVSVPLAKQKDPFLLLSASHDEYMELSSMYHSPIYSNLMHDLFVLKYINTL